MSSLSCYGNCFSGCNNIHWDAPPIMADGRNWASWQPEAVINRRIQSAENIHSNWDYRQYLQKNAVRIMNFNSLENCYDIGLECNGGVVKDSMVYSKSVPFLYNSISDTRQPRYGYCGNHCGVSDLKRVYLTREQLNSRLIAPYISMPK